mmetsp:Transcript_27052/g.25930  ORF Transcript_27052/g.25930 Transcript_27052/m.25930 type:complete len:103 (-) Transcript_27052:835-1143(-)
MCFLFLEEGGSLSSSNDADDAKHTCGNFIIFFWMGNDDNDLFDKDLVGEENDIFFLEDNGSQKGNSEYFLGWIVLLTKASTWFLLLIIDMIDINEMMKIRPR